MLVLTRKVNEKIQIGDNIFVTVVEVAGGKVRLGIDAPREVRITRPDAKKQPTPEQQECPIRRRRMA